MIRTLKALVLSTLCTLALVSVASAQQSILTERYDNSRTGANLNETILNTSNLNVNTFGKLWSYTVDGSVFAQPLYVPGVTIGGNAHNVLYVVTMNDKAYAFDADSNSAPLWTVDFTNPGAGITPVPIVDITGNNNLNIVGNVGIESTPVIDTGTNTMYLVARTKENGVYFQRLHALNITTGAEKFGGPVVLQGSVSGAGTASIGGTLTFDPLIENQRASLAIANGMIFIAWASHEDLHFYHGWVMAYNAQNLTQSRIFCVTPDGAAGGIWHSGVAPVVDANNNVYYASGNGDWNGTKNFGESMLKFSTTPSTFTLADWFTPDNWSYLNSNDLDVGSGGVLLIPGTDLVMVGTKEGIFYITHSASLGHEQTGNGQVVQVLNNNGGHIHGVPVYWNRTTGAGPTMYEWSENNYLKAYHFNGTTFDPTPISQSLFEDPLGHSAGVLTLSANGSTAGTGIVWSSMPLNQDGDHGVVQGVLRAFDANDLTNELWDSNQNPARDNMGLWPKFSPPTVINGKVYMASFSNVVNVYGQFSTTPDFTINATPAVQYVAPGGSKTYTVGTGVLNGFSGTVSLSIGGLPSGATASFNPPSVAAGSSSTLTVNTTAGTPLASSTLTITGTSGALTHPATVTLSVTSTGLAPATSISINFVGQGTAMGTSEIAGAVAKSHWNNASGAHSNSPQALLDEGGNSTNSTVTWGADNTWATPIVDQAGSARMMRGYLDDPAGSPTIVDVSGLLFYPKGYLVIVYADGDNGTASRNGNYQISGPGTTTTSTSLTDSATTNFSGAFTQANNSAGNYLIFNVSGTSFTLTVTPGTSSDVYQRAPLNGIQIVPLVPLNSVSSLIYPAQALGTKSAPQTVTLSNRGIAPVTISSLIFSGANSSDFAIQSNTCPMSPSTLAASSSCIVGMTFAPGASGPRKSALTITSDVPASPSMIVLTGVGTTAGVSPASLTFPDQTTNTGSTPQAVSLTNMGGTPMNIWQIAISGANAADFSKTTTCGISLDASAVCSINVTFTPSAVGARVAKLLLSDDGGGSPQAVPLSGNGVAPAVPAGAITLSSTANQEQTAAAQLNTSSLTFKIQTVGTTSLVRSVVFRNTGTMPVNIAGISISGPAHLDFTEASKCRPRLLPNESCSIRVRFQPHAIGVRTGVISILDNAPGSPHKFSVSGMGIEIERQVGTPVSPSLNHLAPRRRK